MKKIIVLPLQLFLLALMLPILTYGQKKVAITIDDVPNTIKYQKDNFNPILLSQLDTLNIPVTIFVNTGLLYKNDNTDKNAELLNRWLEKDFTTIGYHTHSHLKYSEIGFDLFKEDFEKGEQCLKNLIGNKNKTIKYFRFPYNDLGKDSAQHTDAVNYISSKKYIIAPFTIESEDWVFDYIYAYYLNKKDTARAKEIANEYISKTLEYFDFFDSLVMKRYGRSINQIYLCHDNSINAAYLPVLINELKKKKYTFISFDEALEDDIYSRENKYYKKWGISWLYRWMQDQKEINFYSKQEPVNDTYKLYEQLIREKN